MTHQRTEKRTEKTRSRRDVLAAMLGAPVIAAAVPARPVAGADSPTAGDWRSACAGAIPAHELGVVPGAGVDQTQVLETALRRAAELGRALRLPPGEVLAGELMLDVPVILAGDADSRLVCASGARWLFGARGVARCHVLGVQFDGAGQRRGGAQESGMGLLRLESVKDVQLADCTIRRAAGHGVRLEGCGGRLLGNRLREVGESAIFALDCRELDISRNDIAHCGNGGILVWQSAKRHDGALVAHNRIRHIRADAGGTGQNGNGVNVFRGGGVRVVSNDIADCAFSAVRDNSGDEVVIANNICRRSGEVAIFVEFSFVKAQVANNLVEGAAAGISITNMREGGRLAVVSGNIVRDLKPVRGNLGEEGFGIGAEADTTVVGNVVERAAKYGLALGWGKYLRNVTASGNVVRQSPVGVAVSVVKGAGSAVIAANVFDGVKIGVAGYDHARRVTDELMGAREVPAHVLLNANSRS